MKTGDEDQAQGEDNDVSSFEFAKRLHLGRFCGFSASNSANKFATSHIRAALRRKRFHGVTDTRGDPLTSADRCDLPWPALSKSPLKGTGSKGFNRAAGASED